MMWPITNTDRLLGSVVIAVCLSGCSSNTPTSGTPSATTVKEVAGHGEDGPSGMERMKAELAKLSPEDATSATKQHVCPVSGEMLGTMGVPLKIDVNGSQVWICCDGCKEKLLASPDEYLAKLKGE